MQNRIHHLESRVEAQIPARAEINQRVGQRLLGDDRGGETAHPHSEPRVGHPKGRNKRRQRERAEDSQSETQRRSGGSVLCRYIAGNRTGALPNHFAFQTPVHAQLAQRAISRRQPEERPSPERLRPEHARQK